MGSRPASGDAATECDPRWCYSRTLTVTPISASTPELAAAGAYLGYDGFARARDWPDSVLIDCPVRSAESGATDRLMIGGDVARRTRYVAYGGRSGLADVGRRMVPRLVQAGYGIWSKPSWFATRPLSQYCLPVSEPRGPRDAAQPASFR